MPGRERLRCLLEGHLSCGYGDDQLIGRIIGRVEVDTVQAEEDHDGQPSEALVAVEERVVADDGLEERRGLQIEPVIGLRAPEGGRGAMRCGLEG